MLRDYILKNSYTLPWQEFRVEDLWTRDVNLLFDANLEGLQRLFKKYQNPKDNTISYNDALNIVVRDAEVGVTYKQATAAFGMSKMTVKNEMSQTKGNPYLRMVFVEFLEFLGRVGYARYS